MTTSKLHAEWLSLIEISGPFLTLPVLTRAFPAGLEPTDRELVEELRIAYAEVTDDPALSGRWTAWVLERLLGLPEEVLRHGSAVPGRLAHRVSEYGVELRPTYAVLGPDGEPSHRWWYLPGRVPKVPTFECRLDPARSRRRSSRLVALSFLIR